MLSNSIEKLDPRLKWMNSGDIKPYVLCRQESRVPNPGQLFNLDWFPQDYFYMDPLKVSDVYFANALLNMEESAFASSDMAMPRWVFYDCAIMPGFVSGFAHKTETLPESFKKILGEENLKGEWTPISMFIVIPTMVKNEWVAHNLSSMNALVPKEERFFGLGFLSKSFGLSYGNIEVCCGMTQWDSPAIKLHSNYGFFEILTAYTPAHSYAQTLTYRLRVNPSLWIRFFTHEESHEFDEKFIKAGFEVDPTDESTIMAFHKKIEQKQGPFYLDAREIRQKGLKENFTVYWPRF